MTSGIQRYIKESVEELKKVNWLPWGEAWRMTMLVILFSLTIAILLGALDALFVSVLVR